ncbi:MAG: single-stranded-DNA-specific exonuclease RecJ [Lachnospiraceae bacterium]
MAKWLLVRKSGEYKQLSEEYGIDPVIFRVLKNRGIVTREQINSYLYGDLRRLHNPGEMKDMEKAARILLGKIVAGKKIRIIGDYDIDGVCATAILKKGLTLLGAQVDTLIPHRIQDGYGMNDRMIREAGEDGVDTILTCDNGISAYTQVELAKSLGMCVVITDHHEVPFEEENGMRHFLIPNADAIVDPKQEDCNYPFPGICGGMVAFQLIRHLYDIVAREPEALSEVLRTDEIMAKWPALYEELLQFAAFATVGDVMELKDENRILVKYGLELMSRTKSIGLGALIRTLGLGEEKISAFHIGFVLGPCLNATGRIDSADRALELLTTDSLAEAMQLAGDLRNMNESRKILTERGTEAAIQIIDNSPAAEDVLVVYLADCHESVAGIIAGRLREKYNRPVFVVTRAEEDGNKDYLLKGSGRSIENYHMYNEMTKIRDVFEKFGGHSQAAGFSLRKSRLEEMRRRLNENCNLTPEDFEEVRRIDVDLPMNYCSEKLLADLELLEPLGNGNEKPVFGQAGLQLISARVMGHDDIVGKYTVIDRNGQKQELTLFRRNHELKKKLAAKYGATQVNRLFSQQRPEIDMKIAVIYYPTWNIYRGVRTMQFVVSDFNL